MKFEHINQSRDSFKVRLNDLTEVNHDLSEYLRPNAVGISNGCKFIRLDGNDIETGEKISVKFNKK